MNLFAKFSRHCRKNKVINPQAHILLAVSGGVDSMVMLDLFVQLAKRTNIRLSVGHIDHQLRDESADDARFVEKLCNEMRLPFFIERVSTKTFAKEKKLSVEMAARGLRYEALERLRVTAGAGFIATAHTRSDQAETVLLRLLRGAGLAGLAGIPEKRGKIVRPLLTFSRPDILQYAQQRGLSWREDKSNLDLSISRNRLRHENMPALASRFNPKLEETLARTAHIAREAHDYMIQRAMLAMSKVVVEQAPGRIVLDIQRIKRYNRRIRSYILRLAYARLSGAAGMPNHRRIERAMNLMPEKRIGARVTLGAGFEVLRDRDGLVMQVVDSNAMASEVEVGVPIAIAGTPWQLIVADEAWNNTQTPKFIDKCSEYVDTATIEGRLRVRWARPGDVFYPLGMRQPKKVHDFFADSKVPIRRRAMTPVLECDSGIVWVCGFRIDDRFKVTGTTKSVLHLQLIKSS